MKQLTRRNFLKAVGASTVGVSLGAFSPSTTAQPIGDFKALTAGLSEYELACHDVVDPVLSVQQQRLVRLPSTNPLREENGHMVANLHLSEREVTVLEQADSLMGHRITNTRDPHQDLELALSRLLSKARDAGESALSDTSDAQRIIDIQLGNTQGSVYDGFALLNFNRGAYRPDHLEGQYKSKKLQDTGQTFISQIDGQVHRLWEVTVNQLWLQQDFLGDTFLIVIPKEAHPYDEFIIHWRIYSLIQEDLAPTTVVDDGFGRILHGLDSTFTEIPSGTLGEITIKYPTVSSMRGIYVWGWGVHPPRVQFLQFTTEGTIHAQSFLGRNALMSMDDIGEASPDLKMYNVAQAALNGTPGSELVAMLTDADSGPRGTFREWVRLGSDVRQLPDEAWDVLAEEDGLSRGEFGPYDAVLAYVNNEIYGDTPYAQVGSESKGAVMRNFVQGGTVKIKIINLDNHVHYYRNVDFGEPVVDQMREAFGNGKFSFNKFNPKPTYGHAKVVEMQWRTGWGYTPHLGVTPQPWTFPREEDRAELTPFLDQFGQTQLGYVFKNVSGHWRFSPPAPIRAGEGRLVDLLPPGTPLSETDGSEGVMMGLDTEAFGVAKMPMEPITVHPDQENFANQNFPGFLRNPNPDGGDLIPPTPPWKPYLWLHPETGTLKAPDGSWWVDQTYMHGRPVPPNSSIVANVESPRAGAQLFYQFDPLFHDNMIFSYHPRADIVR